MKEPRRTSPTKKYYWYPCISCPSKIFHSVPTTVLDATETPPSLESSCLPKAQNPWPWSLFSKKEISETFPAGAQKVGFTRSHQSPPSP